MPSRNRTLCIIGDSHMGSVRRAANAGLVDFSGYETEFWGAVGPLFRQQIQHEGGRIRAAGADAEAMVRQINDKGRLSIGPDEFDCYLFYGARCRIAEVMIPFLHRLRTPHLTMSRAVLRAAIDGYLGERRMVRAARDFAAAGARVFYAPSPLLTEGVEDLRAPGKVLDRYSNAVDATAEEAALIWETFDALFARDGITMIRQPADTVSNVILTDNRWAVPGAAESGDTGHKSPEFAARMIEAFRSADGTDKAARAKKRA